MAESLKDALAKAGVVDVNLQQPTPEQKPKTQKEQKKAAQAANTSSVSQSAGKPAAPAKKLGIPKIPQFRDSLIPLTEKEEEAEFQEYLGYVQQIAAAMTEGVSRVRRYENQPEERRSFYSGEIVMVQDGIVEMLSYEDWRYRKIALLSYASEKIRTCPESREWFRILLEDLTTVQFLVQLPEPPPEPPRQPFSRNGRGNGRNEKFSPKPAIAIGLKMFGGYYDLHPSLQEKESLRRVGASKPEVNDSLLNARKIWNSLKNIYERTLDAEHQRWEGRQKSIQVDAGTNQISLADLKDGKPGKIILQVPDLKRSDRFFSLLVESDGEKVRPRRALGAIEGRIEELIEADTFVLVREITRDRDLRGKEGILNSMIRRAILAVEEREKAKVREAEQKAKMEAEFQKRIEGYRAQYEIDRKELAPLAILTDSDFLVDRKVGFWFMDFGDKFFLEKSWNEQFKRSETKKVHGLMAILERDEMFRVRVVKYPERLKGFFLGHMEFRAEGDQFSGLSKLGAAMRLKAKWLGGGQEEAGSKLADSPAAPAVDQTVGFESQMMESAGEDAGALATVPSLEEKPEEENRPRRKVVAKKKKSARRA